MKDNANSDMETSNAALEISKEIEEENRTLEKLDAAGVIMPPGSYGYRQCVQCGKWFKPEHFSRLCCSEECRNARKKDRARRSAVSQLERYKKRISELEAKLAARQDEARPPAAS